MKPSARRARRSRGSSTLVELAELGRHIVDLHEAQAWPAEKWQADPIGFARTILGALLWSFQVEFLEAIRDSPRVSVAGGRKIGKDFAVAVAVLWFYASFTDARVFMTAVTARQIEGILYREVRKLKARSGRCYDCRQLDPRSNAPCAHSMVLTGKVGEVARSGIKSEDFREVQGFTTKEPEGAQGYSGPAIMVVIDEASLVDDATHAVWRGNLAGCREGQGKEVLIGNPTQLSGFHFDSHHSKKALYRTFQVSARSTPNYLEGREVFPGLATRAWVQEQEEDWGPDSVLTAVHIDGKWPKSTVGLAFKPHVLELACARWHDTQPMGRLNIGIDVAGESEEEENDESAFCARRGLKVLELFAQRGLSPEGHLVNALAFIAKYPTPGEELPRIVIDRGGIPGAKVWAVFVAYRQEHDDVFELVGVFPSDRAKRKPEVYDRVRDELIASLAEWMNDGGGIPEEGKLIGELGAFRWEEQLSGRSKLRPKKAMRAELGRSPDRADGLSLSTWGAETFALVTGSARPAPSPATAALPPREPVDVRVASTMAAGDPYAILDSVQGRR